MEETPKPVFLYGVTPAHFRMSPEQYQLYLEEKRDAAEIGVLVQKIIDRFEAKYGEDNFATTDTQEILLYCAAKSFRDYILE